MRAATTIAQLVLLASCNLPKLAPIDDSIGDGISAFCRIPACGPSHASSCCTSELVPGGMFYRFYDVGTDSAFNDMGYPATVTDFRLDTYEVTVGRFRAFVDAGKGTQQDPPAPGSGARRLNGQPSQGGWDSQLNGSLPLTTDALLVKLKACSALWTWTDEPGPNESLPINCVSKVEAWAFCVWDGGFLPTEAQWNYAAAGGSEQRAYPWSSPPSALTIDCTYANYGNGSGCGLTRPAPVGGYAQMADGRWGQADLAGNVEEWTLDRWGTVPMQNPCDDCAVLDGVGDWSRGGSYLSMPRDLRTAATDAVSGPTIPSDRFNRVGVRCARAP